MKELITKVWKDPVWSKVISAGILISISIVFDFTRGFFWNYWYYPVIIFLFCIIFWQRALLKKIPVQLLDIDKHTYEKAQLLFCNRRLIERIRVDDYCSTFKNDIFEFIDELNYKVQKNPVSYEFIDKDFNKLFQETVSLLNEFGDYLAINTWTKESNTQYSSIPFEWQDEQSERYDEVMQHILNLKRKVCSVYDEFTRQGLLSLGLTQ